MKTMRRAVIMGGVLSVLVAGLLAVGLNQAFGATAEPADKEQSAMTTASASYYSALVIGAAVLGGLGCLGAGYAVGHVGAAALGAASERPEMLIRSLIIIALGEGIAILGLAVAFLFIMRLPK